MEQKISIGTLLGAFALVGVIILGIMVFSGNGDVSKADINEISTQLKDFKNEVSENFKITNLQIDTLKTNQNKIIIKIDEVIKGVNHNSGQLDTLIFNTQNLEYGQEQIFIKVSGKKLKKLK